MKTVSLPLLLMLLATPAGAQPGPSTAGLSTEEIVDQLAASRPKGKLTLPAPALLDELEGKTWEQSVVPTGQGMAAWRDIYANDGPEAFGFRQFFVPLKKWKQKTPAQMLDEARTQIGDGTPGTTVEQRDYTLGDCPARSFVIRQPSGGPVVRLDYLLVYPDLYIVSYSGTEAGLKSPRVSRYFASLKPAPVK